MLEIAVHLSKRKLAFLETAISATLAEQQIGKISAVRGFCEDIKVGAQDEIAKAPAATYHQCLFTMRRVI